MTLIRVDKCYTPPSSNKHMKSGEADRTRKDKNEKTQKHKNTQTNKSLLKHY